jgi:DNA-binding NtrC family response regulator
MRPVSPSGPLVLIADDEPQLLRLMERVLQRAHYEVLTARDGDEALRASVERGHEIGTVVLDAAIVPNGAGEVLEAVCREDDPVAVVLTSGDSLAEPLSALLREHEGVFLRKPFPPNALLRAVADSQIRGDS